MTAEQPKRDYVIIVSGLPRSGTSMMMKAIHAGGIEPMIDNIRKADEDNPKGYYEFEPVKKTKEDA
ncbi:MAG: poly-gamma-glutamate hydrolase family protein, partial [Planctomycetota bacterium]